MRIEGDAVVGEPGVEGVAEPAFGGEPHEGALGIDQFLLGARERSVLGEEGALVSASSMAASVDFRKAPPPSSPCIFIFSTPAGIPGLHE